MTERSDPNKNGRTRRQKVFIAAVVLVVAAILFLYLAGKLFLGTPYANEKLSGLLTDFLHQRVTLAGLSLSGTGLSVQGITIENPTGFQKGEILHARSVVITPDWMGILAGKRNLSLLQVEGLQISLVKNAGGDWNYRQLVHFLTLKKKKPAAEFSIKHLILRDASLQVNNLTLKNLALSVNDFSTKGSTNSKLLFTGKDSRGNPIRLAGETRLGKDPALYITLAAPNLSLDTFRDVARQKPLLDLEKAMAHVSLSARYHSGELAAEGNLGFEKLGIVLKDGRIPLAGALTFAARYNASRDEARLERFSFDLNKVLIINAGGIVRQVKGEKEFLATLSCAGIRGKDLRPFLPQKMLRDYTFDGRLTFSDLHLAGSAGKGITVGRGRAFLREGEATKGKSALFHNLAMDINLARALHGWNATGTLSVQGSGGKSPLEELDAGFTAHLSDRFRLAGLAVPRLQARLMGVPVWGGLTYTPRSGNPYMARLTVKDAPVASLNGLLRGKDIHLTSGTADAALLATGRGPASFSGEISAQLNGVKGTVAGKTAKLQYGAVKARFARTGGALSASGNTSIDGGLFADKSFAGSFAFALAGDTLILTGGKLDYNHTALLFSEISGRLPARGSVGPDARNPLSLAFKGLELSAGGVLIKGASGGINGSYTAGSEGRRLDGSGTIALPSVSFRNQPVAAVTMHVTLSGREAVLVIRGSALGGPVTSLVRFDPYAAAKGISYSASLQDAKAEKLSALFPANVDLRASGGMLAAKLSGAYTAQQGATCRIETSGSGINLSGKDGKVLVTGAALTLKGDVAGTDIFVRDAVITQGKSLALKIDGGMTNAASPSRQGKFSIELAATPVNSILDTFANLLPKPLQQANGGGSIGMRGTLGITGSKVQLEGSLLFDKAQVDIPDQKISVTDINGTVPISLFLAGQVVKKPSDELTFSKENYPVLLKNLQRKPKIGLLLKIGKVRFGALETGDLRVYMKADSGRIDFTSIESSLYNGTSTGKGFIRYDNGLNYGTDILINDMSLKLFCSSFPALTGYINGLLDGIISLNGGKGGINAMVGFVDLWAHKGKNEKMLVSKEFLQKMAGKKLKGFFFQNDRPYSNGEISSYLESGFLTFEHMDISHTNLLGMKDLSVSVAPVQNRIGLDHLFQVIREAAARGKVSTGAEPAPEAPVRTDLKWLE